MSLKDKLGLGKKKDKKAVKADNNNGENEKKYPVLLCVTPSGEDIIKVRITLLKPLVPVLSLDEFLITNGSIKENTLIVNRSGLIYEVDIIPSGKKIIEISLPTVIEGDFKLETVETQKIPVKKPEKKITPKNKVKPKKAKKEFKPEVKKSVNRRFERVERFRK